MMGSRAGICMGTLGWILIVILLLIVFGVIGVNIG